MTTDANKLADEIEALASDEMLDGNARGVCRRAADALRSASEKDAEIGRLRKALRPFAELDATNWTLQECPLHMTCDIDATDIHAARAELTEKK